LGIFDVRVFETARLKGALRRFALEFSMLGLRQEWR
jgi:hypothetical protein